VAVTISGCIFDGAGVIGTNAQIDVVDVQGVEIVGCSFSNNGTGVATEANISVGATGGTTKLTVSSCQFFGGTPAQAVKEVGGLGTIVGKYDDNLGFETAVIVSNFSSVNGAKRFNQPAGATTGAFVSQFIYTNQRGLLGVGTIKNTGGVNSLNVKELVTDAFGVSDSRTNAVVAGADQPLDSQTNIGTARAPYVSYEVQVDHPVAATTFNLQFVGQGAQ
jgi:hypothetical protein